MRTEHHVHDRSLLKLPRSPGEYLLYQSCKGELSGDTLDRSDFNPSHGLQRYFQTRRRAQHLHHLIVRCRKPCHLNSEGTCCWMAPIARSRPRKCLPVLTQGYEIEDDMTHGSPTASLPRRAPRHIARAADWRSAWCNAAAAERCGSAGARLHRSA